jgi:ubiquinone/menaquinone biosynthesis C-methylase UbiE
MPELPPAAGKSSFDLIDKGKFLSLFNVPPGSTVLDLACGIGRYSIELSKIPEAHFKIHAVDLWAEGIETLNAVIAAEKITNIHTIVADISRKIPLETASVDVCLLATVLHDLSPAAQDSTLREIERVLKPGSILMIVEFKKIDEGPGPPISIRLNEQEVEDIAARYTFLKSSCDETGAYTYLIKFQKTT